MLNTSSLTGVSVWWVKMTAGLVTGPRRFRTVLDRDQAYRLNIFLIAAPLYAYYDYDAKLVL